MSLSNATALITGGAQGFGKGFARAILELGGKVLFCAVKLAEIDLIAYIELVDKAQRLRRDWFRPDDQNHVRTP